MVNTGLISSIQHFSIGDGPGIRTTIFFQGCNLGCEWCHNPETIPCSPVLLYHRPLCQGCGNCAKVCPNSAHQMQSSDHIFYSHSCSVSGNCVRICPTGALRLSGELMTLEQVFGHIYEDMDFYRASGGGVTFSGGEPLLQADFCSALAERCSSQDIPVIVDTAGHITYSEFEKLLPYKVHFFYDLKAASEEDYRTKTGGSLALAVTNLSRLVSDGAQVTVRIPIIPEFSDSILYCQRLRDILRQTKVEAVHLLPFHRSGSSKYKALNKNYVYEKVQAPSEEKLGRLLKVFAYDFDARIDE